MKLNLAKMRLNPFWNSPIQLYILKLKQAKKQHRPWQREQPWAVLVFWSEEKFFRVSGCVLCSLCFFYFFLLVYPSPVSVLRELSMPTQNHLHPGTCWTIPKHRSSPAPHADLLWVSPFLFRWCAGWTSAEWPVLRCWKVQSILFFLNNNFFFLFPLI